MPLWLRLLAIITFACAVAGLFGPLHAPGGSVARLWSPETVPALLFFGVAATISVLTWRRTPGGVFLLLLLQLVQAVSITATSGWQVVMRCGPVLQVVLAPGGFRLEGGVQASFADPVSSGGMALTASTGTLSVEALRIAPLVVDVNLLALFLAWQLWAHLGRVAAETGAAS